MPGQPLRADVVDKLAEQRHILCLLCFARNGSIYDRLPLSDQAIICLCVPKTSSELMAGMIGLFCFVLAVLASPFKSKLRLEAENAVLRHQLIVLTRRLHGRVRLTNHDRWFFIQLI
jgi:hypothetical protein